MEDPTTLEDMVSHMRGEPYVLRRIAKLALDNGLVSLHFGHSAENAFSNIRGEVSSHGFLNEDIEGAYAHKFSRRGATDLLDVLSE